MATILPPELTPVEDDIYYLLYDNIRYSEQWIEVVYIIGALMFTMSIFGFRNPASAPMANLFGILGMLFAIAATVISSYVYDYGYYIFAGCFVVMGALGIGMALSVKMTSMPQMVGLLNALGGVSAALESFALYVSPLEQARQGFEYANKDIEGILGNGNSFQIYSSVFYCLGMVIGVVTFTGSLVACAKLAEIKPFKKVLHIPQRNLVTAVLLVIMLGLAAYAAVLGIGDISVGIYVFGASALVAAIYGVLFVMAIGGADMPVVIAVLNSLSGWSTVFAGLTFNNSLMIISGSFVGASGIILSFLMCKAMNRSLTNVLMGSFGGSSGGATEHIAHLDAHKADAEICAKYLAGSQSICIIPGYGMAVSRAQHVVASLAEEINNSGRKCSFAVHPVAGRLPGHMNVLLAEANVPYDTVDDLDTANAKFKDIDTCIVIGANDTVNPSAVTDKHSPIYGMPVLQCWEGKRTIVIKRSLNQGYAGIDNPLFFSPNTSMLLGDGSAVMKELLTAFVEKGAQITPDKISPTTTQFISEEHARVTQREAQLKALKDSKPVEEEEEEEEAVNTMLMDETSSVCIGILKEKEGENRVAMIPRDISALIAKDWKVSVYVQKGCGEAAGFYDEEYQTVGAKIMSSSSEIIGKCSIILKVEAPTAQEVEEADREIQGAKDIQIDCEIGVMNAPSEYIKVNGGLVKPMFLSCFGNPSGSKDIQELCKSKKIPFLSMDIMPRVTAAQAMDVLSSTAKIAGYRAVVEAIGRYGRLTSPEITAAGSYPPAKCLVVGCGVAGLQAIGDCHRLGTDVRAFDVRKECADQVVSMGGKFLMLDFQEDGAGQGGYANIMSDEFIAKEMELFQKQAEEVNIFIMTAAIPGRRAPILFKQYHVDSMKRGSVVVDLAAMTGGNCEATKPGENYVTKNGVIMIGKVDFVSQVSAPIASEMLSANIMNWFTYNMARTNDMNLFDIRDPISRAIVLTYEGNTTFPPPRPPAPPAPAKVQIADAEEQLDEIIDKKCADFGRRHKFLNSSYSEWLTLLVIIGFGILFALTAPTEFVESLMILILGAWLGFLLVNGVTSALHTPLMSLTNAISGVVILAGLLGVSPGWSTYSMVLDTCSSAGAMGGSDAYFFCEERGLAAVVLNGVAVAAASMNVLGGFAVTQRMLKMFKAR